jgi:hypothetical protein
MPLQNHPQIFACLRMVVGFYGILYLEVARARMRLADCRCGLDRKNTGAAWAGATFMEWSVATRNANTVSDQRLHLVDSIRTLPERRLALFSAGVAAD